MMVAVANSESADEDPPRLLPHHGVPQSRRIIRTLDAKPWAFGSVDLAREPGLQQLSTGGDLTSVGVDEKQSHDHAA